MGVVCTNSSDLYINAGSPVSGYAVSINDNRAIDLTLDEGIGWRIS